MGVKPGEISETNKGSAPPEFTYYVQIHFQCKSVGVVFLNSAHAQFPTSPCKTLFRTILCFAATKKSLKRSDLAIPV